MADGYSRGMGKEKFNDSGNDTICEWDWDLDFGVSVAVCLFVYGKRGKEKDR